MKLRSVLASLGVVMAAVVPVLSGGTASAGSATKIAAVHFSRIGQNMRIEVDGEGFGAAPLPLPAVGVLFTFAFNDITQGNWRAGWRDARNISPAGLQYTSWTDNRIVVDGFGDGYGNRFKVEPGDEVSLFVQRTGGNESATWNGKLEPDPTPALDPGGPTPQIAAVRFGEIGQGMHIEIEGSGFGPPPVILPATGVLNQFAFNDISQGNWRAGWRDARNISPVALQYTSWSDTKIVIDGFGPGYGGKVKVAPGDDVTIFIQHSNGPEYVVWSGPLFPGKQPTAVQLLNPEPNGIVKTGPVRFAWTPVAGAASYYLEVYLAQSSASPTPVPNPTTIVGTQTTAPQYVVETARLLKGVYRWRVAAVGANSELIQPGFTAEGQFSVW